MSARILWTIWSLVTIYSLFILSWNIYLLVIILIGKLFKKCLFDFSSIFLLNLAIADILYCTSVPYKLFHIVSRSTYSSDLVLLENADNAGFDNRFFHHPYSIDNIMNFIRGLYSLTSIWTIAAMSVIREQSITQNRVSKASTKLIAINIWLFAALFALPMPIFFNTPSYQNNFTINDSMTARGWIHEVDHFQIGYLIVWVFISWLIPLFVIIYTMFLIMRYLKINYIRLGLIRSTYHRNLSINSNRQRHNSMSIKSSYIVRNENILPSRPSENISFSSEHFDQNSYLTPQLYNVSTVSSTPILNCTSSDDNGRMTSTSYSTTGVISQLSSSSLKTSSSNLSSFDSDIIPSIRLNNRNHRVYNYLLKVLAGFIAVWSIEVVLYCGLILQKTQSDLTSQLMLLTSPLANLYLYHWCNRNIRQQIITCAHNRDAYQSRRKYGSPV